MPRPASAWPIWLVKTDRTAATRSSTASTLARKLESTQAIETLRKLAQKRQRFEANAQRDKRR
jgi:hypothetical protein